MYNNRMTPPLTTEQEALIKKLYYDDKLKVGRDKMFEYIKANHPSSKISIRQVMAFLKGQESYQLNVAPPTYKTTKPIQTTVQGFIQIDLIDYSYQPIRGFKYLLNAIDVFTKKASSVPLKNKSTATVARNMNKLLEPFNKVSVVQSDRGLEFTGDPMVSYLKNKSIKQILSKAYSPATNGQIERFNGTLKRQLAQYENKDWAKNLPSALEVYNKTFHRTINTTPNSMNNEEVRSKARERIVNARNQNPNNTRLKEYEVGDVVRVVLVKSKLQKKSINTYTKELYTIHKVFKSKLPYQLDSYKLKDEDGDFIQGSYNSTMLQLIER